MDIEIEIAFGSCSARASSMGHVGSSRSIEYHMTMMATISLPLWGLVFGQVQMVDYNGLKKSCC